MKTCRFASTEVPVIGMYDTVVVGGGTAGASAAISAARGGNRVLVVEREGSLGGTPVHALAEDVHLSLRANLTTTLCRGGGLLLQGKLDPTGLQDFVGGLQEWEYPSDTQIGHRLVDDLLHLHGGDAHLEGGRDHHAKPVDPLAAQKRRQP